MILTIIQAEIDWTAILGPSVMKWAVFAFLALNLLRAVMLALEPVVMVWFAPQDFPKLWDIWTKIIKSIDLLTASFPRSQRVTNALFHADRERKGLPPMEWREKEGGQQ